jgi:hypothetical protein
MRPTRFPPATESQEQEALFTWVELQGRYLHPELAWLFHIPNGKFTTPAQAALFQRMGLKPGVPDLFLLVRRRGFSGCCIELKRLKGQLSSPQRAWQAWLTSQGYHCTVCYGWEEAKNRLLWYLDEEAA